MGKSENPMAFDSLIPCSGSAGNAVVMRVSGFLFFAGNSQVTLLVTLLVTTTKKTIYKEEKAPCSRPRDNDPGAVFMPAAREGDSRTMAKDAFA